MTETPDSNAAPEQAPRRRTGGLGSMLLADLKSMAAGMGISGAEQMRKAALVEAIKSAQSATPPSAAAPVPAAGGTPAASAAAPAEQTPAPQVTRTTRSSRARGSARAAQEPTPEVAPGPGERSGEAPVPEASSRRARTRKGEPAPDGAPATQDGSKQDGSKQDGSKQDGPKQDGPKQDGPKQDGPKQDGPNEAKNGGRKQDGQKNDGPKNDGRNEGQRSRNEAGRGDGAGQDQGKPGGPGEVKSGGSQKSDGGSKNDAHQGGRGNQRNDAGSNQGGSNQGGSNQGGNAADLDDDDDESGRGRNRRRRGRDRNRPGAPTSGSGQRNEPDTTILEDDVLVPAAGILDVLDNYAFVRTTGYLPGVDDVYLSLSMVRRFGLRRGDAVVGQVRQPREGERKEKFNPMVRVENVNGAEPDAARQRPDFGDLTALHPQERLRLETGPADLVGRMIDLAAPIGKGQRGLIVSPPKAGKTTVLKQVATAIAANNPECHLMVVLVDERPEEVTDFERSVKGEVIASTFDRPPGDHTSVAELAIERAKRLVELGHDVVVLLDGITRLGRAHNLSTTASGRILSGGVDAAALHPPKRFFGAARNIEDGGSLTILATALVESGSRMDEVIFEEFNGTANMELVLRGDLAERRLFPAVDLVRSGTRREDLLMSEQEVGVVSTLRTTLAALDAPAAHEEVLGRLRATTTNIELLMALQRGR